MRAKTTERNDGSETTGRHATLSIDLLYWPPLRDVRWGWALTMYNSSSRDSRSGSSSSWLGWAGPDWAPRQPPWSARAQPPDQLQKRQRLIS